MVRKRQGIKRLKYRESKNEPQGPADKMEVPNGPPHGEPEQIRFEGKRSELPYEGRKRGRHRTKCERDDKRERTCDNGSHEIANDPNDKRTHECCDEHKFILSLVELESLLLPVRELRFGHRAWRGPVLA